MHCACTLVHSSNSCMTPAQHLQRYDKPLSGADPSSSLLLSTVQCSSRRGSRGREPRRSSSCSCRQDFYCRRLPDSARRPQLKLQNPRHHGTRKACTEGGCARYRAPLIPLHLGFACTWPSCRIANAPDGTKGRALSVPTHAEAG